MRYWFLTLCGALAVMAGDIQPWKDSVTSNGGKPSSVKSEVISLQGGSSYRLDFRMRKTGMCQENKTCLALWGDISGSPRQLASFGAPVPGDGEAHPASFTNDYTELQGNVRYQRQMQAIDEFLEKRIKDTYIVIDPMYKECSFSRDVWNSKF